MKKLLFTITLATIGLIINQAVAQDFFPTKIGELNNGVPVVTYNTSQLKQDWQVNIAANSSITVTFSAITIEQVEGTYFLTGTNGNNSINASVRLVLSGNGLYQRKEQQEAAISGETVLCVGCETIGCRPNGRGGCTPQCNDQCSTIKVKSEFGIVGGS
jgi:hypothetical protein